MFSRLRAFFKSLLHRRRMEAQMDSELRFHMEAYADDLERSGLPRAEAERRARIEFGGVAIAKEDCRQSLGLRLLEEFRQDLRYAARSMRKTPAFTAAAVISLALGIGANTVIFSFVDAVLLKPFAYREPDRLVRLFQQARNGVQQMSGTFADIFDLRDRNGALTDVAAQVMGEGDTNFSGAGLEHAEHVSCGRVTSNYFRVLGIQPVLGRDFLPEENESGRDNVVLLSNRFWREALRGDPLISGKLALLNGVSFRVVGVLPPGPLDRQFTRIWIPASFGGAKERARSLWMLVIGKLKPGVSLPQANVALKAFQVSAQPYQNTWEYESSRKLLLIAFGAVGFVLLIACANVANLMLARAAARRQEVAIRLSIGAGRFRLARQFLTESLMLGAAGGALGALLAWTAMPLVARLMPLRERFFPPEAEPVLDWRVLLFTAGAALFAGALFGLAPALQFSAPPAKRLASRGRNYRLQWALLTAETALALVLAIGAGLMTHSFARLMAVDPGYRPERVLTWSIRLSPDRYQGAAIRTYLDEFLARLRRFPSVQTVAAANATPRATFDGAVDCAPHVSDAMYWTVTPEYLPAVRIPLVTGRWLLPSDTAGTPPVAVIDRKVARDCFGDANPVGRSIRLRSMKQRPVLEVVGVAGSVSALGLASRGEWGGVYLPLAQASDRELPGTPVFLARTREDPAALAPTIRAIAASLDKDQAVFEVTTMEDILAEDAQLPRFRAVLFGSFGVLALVLAAAGVYGVLHYAVAQRTHEIGVRMALGARRRDIVVLVLRQSMLWIAAGMILGLAASLALTRILARMLFEIKPRDPSTFIGVVAVVSAAALIAAWLPARKAAAVQPVVTLRHE